MIPVEARLAITDLFADYGACLDGDRLEDWLDCFIEGCEYRIVSRENLRRGLPLSLMLCENKDMLRDRVVSLREANEYSVHTDKHVIGSVRVKEAAEDGYAVEAGYAMFQADAEGTGSLYSFGHVRSRVRVRGRRAAEVPAHDRGRRQLEHPPHALDPHLTTRETSRSSGRSGDCLRPGPQASPISPTGTTRLPGPGPLEEAAPAAWRGPGPAASFGCGPRLIFRSRCHVRQRPSTTRRTPAAGCTPTRGHERPSRSRRARRSHRTS